MYVNFFYTTVQFISLPGTLFLEQGVNFNNESMNLLLTEVKLHEVGAVTF